MVAIFLWLNMDNWSDIILSTCICLKSFRNRQLIKLSVNLGQLIRRKIIKTGRCLVDKSLFRTCSHPFVSFPFLSHSNWIEVEIPLRSVYRYIWTLWGQSNMSLCQRCLSFVGKNGFYNEWYGSSISANQPKEI